jgi:hypothetical protein
VKTYVWIVGPYGSTLMSGDTLQEAIDKAKAWIKTNSWIDLSIDAVITGSEEPAALETLRSYLRERKAEARG